MREEEGARYLSPLVKQDLAMLDTDGDTRRLAVKSLKLFVEQLDASTLPRFISQIAESREPGATRCYAISLYEEVARVHGKLVVPHIAKVIGALVRSSSASASFPQLQVACARVAAALARHCIDSSTPQDEAEEIMREICTPLIDALAGKLEPVAATAAACIHALAETEKWKYAREELVHDVCQRTTVALSEKSTRTAAHMQLIRILASVNPDVLCLHGASLLRAGEEILKGTANPWQLRRAAAQQLQSVLTILDKETLETELTSALYVLDSCRLDRMPHVRAAVSEALHTAKMLASGTTETHTSFGMAASPVRRSPTDRSPWLHDDHVPASPVSKRGSSPRAPPMSPGRASPRPASTTSQESRRLSISSPSTSASESVQASRSQARSLNKGGFRAKRAPLYPARAGMSYGHSPRTPGTSPSSSTTTVEECESPSRRLSMKEFNVLSRSPIPNGHAYLGKHEAGHGDMTLRPRVPLQEGQDLDVTLSELTRDSRTTQSPKGREDSGLVQLVAENTRSKSSSSSVEMVLPRLKLGGINNNSLDRHEHSIAERIIPKASSMSFQAGSTNNDYGVAGAPSHINEYAGADVEVEKRQIFTSETPTHALADALQPGSLNRYFKHLAHVDVNLEEKTAEEFLPFMTPKRLVRSLSKLSTPASAMLDQDMMMFAHEEFPPSTTNPMDVDAAEMASETGWSVRDNPIASEESYRGESSDEETRCKLAYESSPRLISDCSPRETRMFSPSHPLRSSFDNSLRSATPDPDADHPCPSCVSSSDQTFKLRVSTEDIDAPCGLPSLLHKDESNNLLESSIPTKCSEVSDHEAEDPPKRRSEKCLVTRLSQSWKKLCGCTESALGGSLCLIIALPLAMILAKGLTESRGEVCRLVPT